MTQRKGPTSWSKRVRQIERQRDSPLSNLFLMRLRPKEKAEYARTKFSTVEKTFLCNFSNRISGYVTQQHRVRGEPEPARANSTVRQSRHQLLTRQEPRTEWTNRIRASRKEAHQSKHDGKRTNVPNTLPHLQRTLAFSVLLLNARAAYGYCGYSMDM